MSISPIITVPLNESEFHTIVANTRVTDLRMEVLRTPALHQHAYESIPDFGEYQFTEDDSIILAYSTREFSDTILGETLDLLGTAEQMTGRTPTGRFATPHPASQHDPSFEGNVEISFGESAYGAYITIEFLKPCYTPDFLEFHKEVFQDFFENTVPGQGIEAVVVDGKLDIRLLPQSRLVLPRQYVSPDMYDREQANLVTVAMTTDDHKNPTCVVLNCFKGDQVRQTISHLARHYGSERVREWGFTLFCPVVRLGPFREFLNKTVFRPWNIMFTAKPKYDLDSLDKAIAEFDSFWLSAFKIKPRGIGEVSVNLAYTQGTFTLFFYHGMLSERQYQRLRKLITELAGGKDILVEEPFSST